MRRYNNNSRQGWGANRPDYFPNGSSRRENAIGRRDNVGFNRQQTDEGDREGRPTEDANHDDSVGYKLDRLIDRLDRWDSWRDETDRRFDNLEPNPNRWYDQRTWYEDDDSDGDGARRRHSWERGFRPRNPNCGACDSPRRDRYRREGRIQRGSCWDPPRYQQHRHQIGGYDQQFNRPATCYDPPQSRQPSCWEPSRGYSDYDQPPLVPPSRWDPPDYRCPQTLQPTKFDRPLSHRTAPLSTVATHPPQQSSRFIDSGKQPSSLTAAMALAVELADTQADRASQQHPPTGQRRQWQNRDSRGQTGFTPSHMLAQPSSTAGVNSGTAGRTADTTRPQLIRVSHAEKAECARKGLCYYCPKKWIAGHVCKQRLLCYADEDDDLDQLEEDSFGLEDNSTDEMKMVVASLNDVQVSSKNAVGNCWGKKKDGAFLSGSISYGRE